MDQDEQRALGVQIAKQQGADATAQSIADKRQCFADILSAAVAEKGLDVVVTGLLQGPPQWAAEALRHLSDLGPHRDALAARSAEDPGAAHYVLYHGAGVGEHRAALVAATAGDPSWAHMTLREVSDLGEQRDSLLAAVATDPDTARLALEQITDLGPHRDSIAAAAARATN
jgi:hypothetical protein